MASLFAKSSAGSAIGGLVLLLAALIASVSTGESSRAAGCVRVALLASTATVLPHHPLCFAGAPARECCSCGVAELLNCCGIA
jgi:hypothetical protein